MTTRNVVIDFTPREWQRKVLMDTSRFKTVVIHRRAGKSYMACMEMIYKMLTCKKPNPRGVFVAETKEQAKEIIWSVFKQILEGVPYVTFKESESKIVLPNNAMILLKGTENPDTLRGAYYDHIIIDEAGKIPRYAWFDVLRPTLADRLGSATMVGTPPKADNSLLYELHQRGSEGRKDWSSHEYTYLQTNALSQEELDDMKSELTPEAWQREMLVSWYIPHQGSYFGSVLNTLQEVGSVGTVPYDPIFPVYTAWDIGHLRDPFAIWFFQIKPTGYYFIDHMESQEPLTKLIPMVLSKYPKYEYHMLPWDIKHRNGSDGSSRLDMFLGRQLPVRVAPKPKDINDAIQVALTVLPKCKFDSEKCKKGILFLRSYRSEYDMEKGVFSNKPLHDHNSHSASAFIYFASLVSKLSTKMVKDNGERREIHQGTYSTDYDPTSFRLF